MNPNNYNKHQLHLDDKELVLKELQNIVDRKSRYPCSVSLEDGEIGKEILLFMFEHHKTASPYQSIRVILLQKF